MSAIWITGLPKQLQCLIKMDMKYKIHRGRNIHELNININHNIEESAGKIIVNMVQMKVLYARCKKLKNEGCKGILEVFAEQVFTPRVSA
jgi:hypothetical protein